MSIIQWKLVEKVPLPQNDITIEMSTVKVPVNASESFVQPNAPVPIIQQFDVMATSESVKDCSMTSLECNMERTVDTNEEQSEGSSLDPGEQNCEEPSNETSEEQTESTITEDQQENSPVS